MSQWKATLPRENAAPGRVQMVVAAKNERGSRFEFCCEVSDMKSKLLIKLVQMTDEQIIAELNASTP